MLYASGWVVHGTIPVLLRKVLAVEKDSDEEGKSRIAALLDILPNWARDGQAHYAPLYCHSG